MTKIHIVFPPETDVSSVGIRTFLNFRQRTGPVQ